MFENIVKSLHNSTNELAIFNLENGFINTRNMKINMKVEREHEGCRKFK